MTKPIRGVYLIHFDTPYRHAQHYIGYSGDVTARIEEHGRGQGARLMQVIVEAGITFRVAKIWRGKSRKFERQLKNRKGAGKFCPICQKEHKQ